MLKSERENYMNKIKMTAGWQPRPTTFHCCRLHCLRRRRRRCRRCHRHNHLVDFSVCAYQIVWHFKIHYYILRMCCLSMKSGK